MPQDPILVEVEGMGLVEFPAGTSPAQIQSALMSTRSEAKKDPTVWDRILTAAHSTSPMRVVETVRENLPTAGGMVGGIVGAAVGGIPGAIGGAAIGGAAGSGYEQALDAAEGKPTPTTELGAVKQMAGQAALQGGLQAVGGAVGAGMAKAAPRLMQSAVKPTASLLKEYKTTAPKLVQTLLDEGINVTQNGLSKLQRLFEATNKEIRTALVDRDALLGRLGLPQAAVDKKRVAASTLSTASRFSKQTNPTSALKAIGETTEEFLDHPVYKGNLTLPEAQDMKIGTYREIGKKYGEVSSAHIEAQKALARGLKDEIAAEVPQITALNQRDSQLMAATDAVGRRIALAGNRDPAGFAWVTQNPVTFLAALMDRSPLVKSLLARGMYANAARAAKVTPDALRLAVAAIAQGASPEPDEPPPPQ